VDARMGRPFLGSGDGDRLPVNVAHLGDSLTVAAGGRAELYTTATATGARIVSRGAFSGGAYPADRHSGVNGNAIEQMEARIATDVTPYRPEVVIVHAGTNNLPGDTAATMGSKLSSLLAALRAALPGAYIIACQIPPRVGYEAKVADFNALIPGVVSALADARIVEIDPGLSAGDISGDGVHPSAAGYVVLGAAWWSLGVHPYLDLPRP
jgi:lysophospholipase L1-like esterase